MKAAVLRAVLIVGALYAVVGIVFGAFAGRATTMEMRTAWRWAAWMVSIVAFEAHVGYDQLRLRGSPVITALRVASAAALGAFGLAVAANIHAQSVSPDQRSVLLLPSLAIWPLVTGVPAFVVALVSAALLNRARRYWNPS